MQIIIKKDLLSNSEKVINILYGENSSYIEDWISIYINQEIDKLKVVPCEKPIIADSIDYYIEVKDDTYYLAKRYNVRLNGYIYNSSKKVSDNIFSIRCLSYDNIDPLLNKIQTQPLWNDINSEITHRIMKHVDKDTLYQINMKFDGAIKTKDKWNSTELVMLQNEITQTHKKELYSYTVRKMKNIEKKKNNKEKSLPLVFSCKTILADGNNVSGLGGIIPDLSQHFGNPCALEYHIINKKQKYE